MVGADVSARFSLADRVGESSETDGFGAAVEAGLTASPKTLPCVFFYDEAGSILFEKICDLPEYYLTWSEREILQTHAADIVNGLPETITLVELGSGSAVKTRLLIDALFADRDALRFAPIDVSKTALEGSAESLLNDYPNLEIDAFLAQYEDGVAALKEAHSGPELILWLGSSIGNLTREAATAFLTDIRSSMADEDKLLVGVDLRKSAAILEPAYDDAEGVTGQFNKNVLNRVNAELGGQFDLEQFSHKAVYDEKLGRVEMHLVSKVKQVVSIDDLEVNVSFEVGESIHTENSYKYSLEEIEAVAAGAGLRIEKQWFDKDRKFSLNMMAASKAL